jgi:hypothetical protein
MKATTLLTSTVLALAGWFALAFASTLKSPSFRSYQVAQNEHNERHQGQAGHDWKDRDDETHEAHRRHNWKDRGDERHKAQRGHDWKNRGDERHEARREYEGKNPGDEWYQGQRGHWYKKSKGWQFGSQGLVCNAQGRNCHRGGYIPANGEGMVNAQNPNLYWSCDSDGHHCHWKPRSRY